MSAINFVVRDDAGTVQRGALADADGSTLLVTQGQDVSLNLQRGNILSYVRQGQALQITLVDGQVLTIQGFFTPEGVPNADLFISANGALSAVDLTAGDGNLLYAQYLDGDSFGKWSPEDDLYFVRGSDVVVAGVETSSGDPEAAMLGTGLLAGIGGLGLPAGAAAAGLGSALLLTGGGGEDDGGDDGGTNNGGGDGLTPPVVDITDGTGSVDHVVDGADHSDGVEIGGTGTPGGQVTVVVEGTTKETVVDPDGTWEVVFTPDEVPGGERETEVEVTITTDGGTATATDTLVIDTETTVTFASDIVETDGVINLVEESDGFTLTGTTEEGASVVVTIDGVNYDATVTGTSWSLDVGAGVIAGGEYDLNVSVTATDIYNNSATTTGTVRVDTVTDVSVATAAVGDDGTINAVEHAGGVTVTGQAQPGSTVVVTAGTGSYTVTATQGGTWSATFNSSEIAEGTYDLDVTAVATDPAGNTATATGTVHVDTELDVTINTADVEGDGVINAVERADGVTLTGTTEANATVVVTFGSGTTTVMADGSGNWSANFSASQVPEGQLIDAMATATATDAAGNVATTSGTVKVDTVLDVTVNTDVTADGVINFVEREDGLTLTGMTEGNASVSVTFNGVVRTTTADSSGNWSADWPTSAIPSGERDVPVSVTATDAAGNVATTTGAVEIDTFVNRLAFQSGAVEGDDIVNNAEASDGLTMGGVVEVGSQSVIVTFSQQGGGEAVTKAASISADGTWSVTFTPAEIAQGTYTANVTVVATDAAGNTAQIEDTFAVDTDPNAAADLTNYTDGDSGVSGITTTALAGDADIDVVRFDGTAPQDLPIGRESTFEGETSFQFSRDDYVPDGSHLVVTDTDTSGNTNSTLVVLDDTATNDVGFPMANLAGYNIGAIDLDVAEDSDLTISVADIKALSDNDDNLIIDGGADDSVTLSGTATVTGATETINDQTYKVVDLGDDSTLLINDQIQFSTI